MKPTEEMVNKFRSACRPECAPCSACINDGLTAALADVPDVEALQRRVRELEEALERIKRRLSDALNNYLCDMKEGYDDSIIGFNEAWDVIRPILDDEIGRAREALKGA